MTKQTSGDQFKKIIKERKRDLDYEDNCDFHIELKGITVLIQKIIQNN